MQNSETYLNFHRQLKANGRERLDGYDPQTLERVFDWERSEVEDTIWDYFNNHNDVGLSIFLPKLKKYDGIEALKSSKYLNQVPSEISVVMSRILYDSTGDDRYLNIIKENINAAPNAYSYVAILSRCKVSEKVYQLLKSIYINNDNSISRSTAFYGILYNKGIVKDINSAQEMNDTIPLRMKYKSEDKFERERLIEQFEKEYQ